MGIRASPGSAGQSRHPKQASHCTGAPGPARDRRHSQGAAGDDSGSQQSGFRISHSPRPFVTCACTATAGRDSRRPTP